MNTKAPIFTEGMEVALCDAHGPYCASTVERIKNGHVITALHGHGIPVTFSADGLQVTSHSRQNDVTLVPMDPQVRERLEKRQATASMESLAVTLQGFLDSVERSMRLLNDPEEESSVNEGEVPPAFRIYMERLSDDMKKVSQAMESFSGQREIDESPDSPRAE